MQDMIEYQTFFVIQSNLTKMFVVNDDGVFAVGISNAKKLILDEAIRLLKKFPDNVKINLVIKAVNATYCLDNTLDTLIDKALNNS